MDAIPLITCILGYTEAQKLDMYKLIRRALLYRIGEPNTYDENQLCIDPIHNDTKFYDVEPLASVAVSMIAR